MVKCNILQSPPLCKAKSFIEDGNKCGRGGHCQEIFPFMKEKIGDLYFLEPDIKKITKHRSIRGVNCIFSPTHPTVSSLSLSSSSAPRSECE